MVAARASKSSDECQTSRIRTGNGLSGNGFNGLGSQVGMYWTDGRSCRRPPTSGACAMGTKAMATMSERGRWRPLPR